MMDNRYRHIIRQSNRFVRRGLSPEFQHRASHRVYHILKRTHFYRYAKHIALYMSFGGEVDLSPIWKAAPAQGKQCYFPSLQDNKSMIFLPATPRSAFKKNRFNIDEPDLPASEAVDFDDLQLVLMPLVAFDPSGRRLGMGGGYYDRTFEHLLTQKEPKTHLIGIAYEFQKQEWLPEEPWDVPLDIIVTENRIYWCSERSRLFK